MIVVDTNIIGYFYLTSNKSALADKSWQKDPIWAAPLLWRSEMRNVLSLYIRKNILSLSDAGQIMNEATDFMLGKEYDVNSFHVLQLVTKSACSAYDCEFVALARDLKVPLVTADQQILIDFPETAFSLEEFAAS